MDILKWLSQVVSPQWMKITIFFLCAYYAFVGAAKILDLVKGITPEKRLSLQKAEMEILKLQYEIAALKKTNDLSEIAFTNGMQSVNGLAKASIGNSIPTRLWAHQHSGRRVLIVVFFMLDLFGFLCAGVIVIAVRQYLLGAQMDESDYYGACVIAALGATAFYLSLSSVGQVIKTEAPKMHRILLMISGGIGLLTTAAMWLKQSH
jgi:hypothetical protein